MRDSISLFYTPSQAAGGQARAGPRDPAGRPGDRGLGGQAPRRPRGVHASRTRSPPTGCTTRATCRTCSAKARASWPRALPRRRRLRGQAGAGQARRDLHAQGSRRRPRRNRASGAARARRRRAYGKPSGKSAHMIAEAGAFALILALALSIAQVGLSVAGRIRRSAPLAGAGEGAALGGVPGGGDGLRGPDARLRGLGLLGGQRRRRTRTRRSRCSIAWPGPGAATRARCCCGAWRSPASARRWPASAATCRAACAP